MSSGSLVQSQSPTREATSATCASQRSAVPTRPQSSPTSRATGSNGATSQYARARASSAWDAPPRYACASAVLGTSSDSSLAAAT